MFFDGPALLRFIEDACGHYERTAPTVAEWLDGVYVRLQEKPESVSVADLLAVRALRDGDVWQHPNYAANGVYKHMERSGLSTAGHAGF